MITDPKFYPQDAERSVLGGLIIDNSKYSEISKILVSSDFYDQSHQVIFDAMGKLFDSGSVFDVITIPEYLKKEVSTSYEVANVFQCFEEIVHVTSSAANILHYAKLVKENACKRGCIKFFDEMKQEIIYGSDLNKILTNSNCRLQEIGNSYNLKNSSELVAIDFFELLARELPSRELILSPWLPKAGLAMIHARPGIGKTHLSLNIAYAVSTGGNFLGWRAEKPIGVLFIDGEMPAITFQERSQKIFEAGEHGKYPQKLSIINPDFQRLGMPDLGTKEGQDMVNEHITDEIDLIIVDNLSCLVRTGKENDSESWQPVQSWALNLRARGKSVLFIHHQGKSGSQRGSSKKEDVLDSVIALKRPEDYDSTQGARFIVSYEKSRGFHGDDAKPFEAHLIKDTDGKYRWKTRTVEESNYEKIVSMTNDGLSQADIAAELDVNKSTVSRHITRAKSEGLIKSKVA